MVHLIYLHQGHTAVPSYLNKLSRIIEPLLNGESHIARANPWPTSTMFGIDVAVNRAVEELYDVLRGRPEVTQLSLVGVSLGGVILERVAQVMYEDLRYPRMRSNVVTGRTEVINPELLHFIAFASPLNGITIGWNFPTLVAKTLGWLNPTLKDLAAMHNKIRDTVIGISLFKSRICLGNLNGDWRVPLSSAFPVGSCDSSPWSVGTQHIVQTALDSSSCIWHAVVLDLQDRWRVHHAIVDDVRSQRAIRDIIENDNLH